MNSNLPYEVRTAGAHYHDDAMGNLINGEHTHLLDDMKTMLRGGSHSHAVGTGIIADTQGQMSPGGEHVHEILLADGARAITQPIGADKEAKGGQHIHEVTPEGETPRSGQHIHTIEMPDGTTHKTLGFDEIRVLVQKGQMPVTWRDVI